MPCLFIVVMKYKDSAENVMVADSLLQKESPALPRQN